MITELYDRWYLQVRRRKRKARLEAYRNKQFYMFGASLAAAVAHIAWVGEGTTGWPCLGLRRLRSPHRGAC